jgi:hypothetical protein
MTFSLAKAILAVVVIVGLIGPLIVRLGTDSRYYFKGPMPGPVA